VQEADPATQPSSGELQPGNGVDGDRIRVDERAHIAEDQIGVAVLEQGAGALAEHGKIGASDRTPDHQHDRARVGRRSSRIHWARRRRSAAANG
jgi:hypothetical protein